jgi:hypothetical protein
MVSTRSIVLAVFLAASPAATFAEGSAAKAQSKAKSGFKDPLGLAKDLQRDLDQFVEEGETKNEGLGILIVVQEKVGWELRGKAPLKIVSVENGKATVKDRNLPAAIVTAELQFVNKADAKYDTKKIYWAAVSDKEFDVWRAPLFADTEDMDKELDDWKKTVGFEPGAPAAASKSKAVAPEK